MFGMASGGARENAGRKDAYGGKDAAPVPMVLTPSGDALLVAACEATGLSRNDVMTHLALRYASLLRFDGDGVAFPGKDYRRVRSIRVTTKARTLLDKARERTGKSYSDLGESLLARYAASCRDWPAPYVARAHTRKKKNAHGR